MKKTPIKNTKKIKKAPVLKAKSAAKVVKTKPCVNPWSLSIYVYWFIILFFIAATFYILGRSHGVLDHRATPNDNVVITHLTANIFSIL